MMHRIWASGLSVGKGQGHRLLTCHREARSHPAVRQKMEGQQEEMQAVARVARGHLRC